MSSITRESNISWFKRLSLNHLLVSNFFSSEFFSSLERLLTEIMFSTPLIFFISLHRLSQNRNLSILKNNESEIAMAITWLLPYFFWKFWLSRKTWWEDGRIFARSTEYSTFTAFWAIKKVTPAIINKNKILNLIIKLDNEFHMIF